METFRAEVTYKKQTKKGKKSPIRKFFFWLHFAKSFSGFGNFEREKNYISHKKFTNCKSTTFREKKNHDFSYFSCFWTGGEMNWTRDCTRGWSKEDDVLVKHRYNTYTVSLSLLSDHESRQTRFCAYDSSFFNKKDIKNRK